MEEFAKAGADLITVHIEACSDVTATLSKIRALGVKTGLSIKPGTPKEALYPYLPLCDMILVMSVEPGYGGQKLIPETMIKLKELKDELAARALPILLEVDGGVNGETASVAREAGADVLVAGSAVFGKPDYRLAMDVLRA